MQDLLSATLIELTDALRTRRVSAVELMQACLARADATHADLNALVARRDPEVLLADAREADARIARDDARPLEGIPFGVKDLEDLAGLPTTQGSLPFSRSVARADSVQVARLRAAGGIPVGKTNTPEFGYTAITKNRVFGVTRSPWDLARTPGGSSGGSAALVAAGVLPIATASDGGGSIRIPASFVGAFGLKPSFGRVPNAPREAWGFGDTTCQGPLTRSVEDAALFLDQVVGPAPGDPNSLPHPGLRYLDAVRAGLPPTLRIGFSPALGTTVVQSDVAEVVREAAGVFEKLGHSLEEIASDPGTRAVARAMMLEAQAIAEKLGVHFPIGVDERIDAAGKLGAHKTSMLQDLERGRPLAIDALVTAVQEMGRLVAVPTPVLDTVLALVRQRAEAVA